MLVVVNMTERTSTLAWCMGRRPCAWSRALTLSSFVIILSKIQSTQSKLDDPKSLQNSKYCQTWDWSLSCGQGRERARCRHRPPCDALVAPQMITVVDCDVNHWSYSYFNFFLSQFQFKKGRLSGQKRVGVKWESTTRIVNCLSHVTLYWEMANNVDIVVLKRQKSNESMLDFFMLSQCLYVCHNLCICICIYAGLVMSHHH